MSPQLYPIQQPTFSLSPSLSLCVCVCDSFSFSSLSLLLLFSLFKGVKPKCRAKTQQTTKSRNLFLFFSFLLSLSLTHSLSLSLSLSFPHSLSDQILFESVILCIIPQMNGQNLSLHFSKRIHVAYLPSPFPLHLLFSPSLFSPSLPHSLYVCTSIFATALLVVAYPRQCSWISPSSPPLIHRQSLQSSDRDRISPLSLLVLP